MSSISDLPFVNAHIDYDHYTRPSDRDGLAINTHYLALPPFTNSATGTGPLSSADGEDGSNHPDQKAFISDLDVVDVDIDYDYYTRPSDPNGLAVNTHFLALPPFTVSATTGPLSSTGGDDGSNDGDCETVCPSFFSSSKKPEPVRHPNAIEAYFHIMSGLLVQAVVDRRGTPQIGDKIFIPDAGHTHGQLKGRERRRWPYSEEQQRLEASKRFLCATATAIPMVLFRGFHDESGGGLDARLNTRKSVIPHAFLKTEGSPSMWDLPNPQQGMTLHLQGNKEIQTHYSSWSQMLHTAIIFAARFRRRKTKNPKILVLVTKSILDRVWYSPDLESSGLAAHSFRGEYLIHGVVSGPKYHCVSTHKIGSVPGSLDILAHFVPQPLEYAVKVSRGIARVLQPRKTTLDIILMLTAKFVAVHMVRSEGLQQLSHPRVGGFLYCVRDALQTLAMHKDARHICLAVPNVSTEFDAALVLELQMLLAAENAVHIMGWTWQAAASRFYHPYLKQLEERYCKRVSETSKKRKGSTIRDSRPLKRRRLS